MSTGSKTHVFKRLKTSQKTPKILLGLTFLGLAVLFVEFPQIDLWFSSIFYQGGKGFIWKENWFFAMLYYSVPVIVTLTLIVVLIQWVLPNNRLIAISRRQTIYLILVLALGPGLLVNFILKDHWGRARPRNIIQFNGKKSFTPAFIISDQCGKNSSFVSGHASIGFFLMSYAFIARRRRKIILLGAMLFGAMVGLARIAQGGHFLSDVVFSGFAVYFIAMICHHCLFRQESSDSNPTISLQRE